MSNLEANHPRCKRRARRGMIATPEIEPAPLARVAAHGEVNVGAQLRKIRTQQKLSLRQLAEMSGLNFNTLSLIENGKSSPSVSTLQQLARALRVPITVFFEIEQPYKQVVFQKSGERPKAAFAHGVFEDLGAGVKFRGGQPMLVTLEPGADSGPSTIVHTGHEFVFCLAGSLTYEVQNQVYELNPGDSLLFEAHLPHRWGNAHSTLSQSLLILCPADENDRSTEQHFSQTK